MEKNLKIRARKNKRLMDLLTKQHQPGYTIIRHPRFLNKPIRCLAGKHDLKLKMINGFLHYYCPNCGMAIGQGIHDRTWTKQEIHKIKQIRVGRDKPRTKEETLKESWEAMEILRTKFTDKEIKEMIERRRRGLV